MDWLYQQNYLDCAGLLACAQHTAHHAVVLDHGPGAQDIVDPQADIGTSDRILAYPQLTLLTLSL